MPRRLPQSNSAWSRSAAALLAAAWLLAGLAHSAWAQKPMSLSEVQGLLERVRTAYAAIDDYTCIFYSRMAQDEDTEPHPRNTILLKFRKPFSIYMKWVAEPHKGREIIFVRGKWEDKMWLHNGDFPDVTLCLDPFTVQSMTNARHSVMDAGMGPIIKYVQYNVRKAEENPLDNVKFWDHGQDEVYGQPSRCFEGVMPAKKDSGYYGHRAKVCINDATSLLTRVTIWDHRNVMVEDLGFTDVKINPGLADKDFDPDSKDYDF